MVRLGIVIALALPLFWICLSAAPQGAADAKDLAPGKFLVARRSLRDPNFAETVVLLVQYDSKGAMGLIINRATDVAISKLLSEPAQAKKRRDPVYEGGPVSRSAVLALVRSREAPEDTRLVFGDVYLVSTQGALDSAMAQIDPSSLRVYFGYSGWGAGQLERELDAGAWQIFKGDAAAVFDLEPESVWKRYIRRTELRIVRWAPSYFADAVIFSRAP